jgi:hypothetical protein
MSEKKYSPQEAAVAVLKKVEEMLKSEKSKHDRCVEHVEANSPEVKNAHAVCVAEGVKPAKWEKSEKENEIGTKLKKDGATAGNPTSRIDSGFGRIIVKSEEKTENKKVPSDAQHPRIKEEAQERDYKDFETKSGSSKSSDDHRLAEQKDPQHNPKEEAEGNNELAGTTPTQVGKDGKNKPGYDEMKSHLKLARFMGYMDAKRKGRSAKEE